MKQDFARHAANQNQIIATDLARQLKSIFAGPARPAPLKAAPAAAATTTGAAPQRDGMMGGLFFDCLFGLPLTDLLSEAADMEGADFGDPSLDLGEQMAAHGAPALSCGMAVDLYDEYRHDRLKHDRPAQENRTNGKMELGVVKLGVMGAATGLFNHIGNGGSNGGGGTIPAPVTAAQQNLADHHAQIAQIKRPPGFYMNGMMVA